MAARLCPAAHGGAATARERVRSATLITFLDPDP